MFCEDPRGPLTRRLLGKGDKLRAREGVPGRGHSPELEANPGRSEEGRLDHQGPRSRAGRAGSYPVANGQEPLVLLRGIEMGVT